MKLRIASEGHWKRLQAKCRLLTILFNAANQAVGSAYERNGRLYADPDSLTEPLICPPPGSWTGRLSEFDRAKLLRARIARNRLSAADREFLFGCISPR